MRLTFKAKCTLSIIAFLFIYLFVVALWATLSIGKVISGYSNNEGLPIKTRVEAILLVEDPNFLNHHGIDVSPGQGLTTLTSSLASEIFLGEVQFTGLSGSLQHVFKSIFNCCKAIDIGRDVMALVIDAKLSKDMQLNLYLSKIYMGHKNGSRVSGFYNAAKIYYGKKLSELTDDEFYSLLAIPLAPNRYNPQKNKMENVARAKKIRMLVEGKCEANGWLDVDYINCDPTKL